MRKSRPGPSLLSEELPGQVTFLIYSASHCIQGRWSDLYTLRDPIETIVC